MRCLAIAFLLGTAHASDLHVEMSARVPATKVQGRPISVSRLDFLISDFALRQEDGSWLQSSNWQEYVSLTSGRTNFALQNLPATKATAVRFLIGLPNEINHANPAAFAPQHPLNPLINGLHWGWSGGYVFLALEGIWGMDKGFSFHLANAPQLMTVELPIQLDLTYPNVLRLQLDVGKIFSGIVLNDESSSTHSRDGDRLALALKKNVENAFVAVVVDREPNPTSPGSRLVLVAPNAVPYPFTFSALFPQPAVPLDNPLTHEGVDLGRFLFSDRRLSRGENQSCASCHLLDAAGADPNRAFSVGSDGKLGARNAMGLFNLAWKQTFFWDGRAASLRDQVLQPIENPVEMHQSLSNVLEKLDTPRDRDRFAKAFGSDEISPDRMARAFEQYLLTLVSDRSKCDQALTGSDAFTGEEARGFELFHTEYDPRREQFGADCFHCHGGPLFQSVAFANNGLDLAAKDSGRMAATGKKSDLGKFATPSLRNVALTAPYMHDGRFKTLEEVVAHYSDGIKRSDTLDPNLAKHPDGGVHLSKSDQAALVAFLKTLTDERLLNEKSVALK